jgi:large conductance mechanosensitive channel
MKIIQEFKAFAMRGNMVDLAVGVIIGAAFGNIINSLVKDVIMPPIGVIINNVDFNDLALRIAPPIGSVPPVVIRYGAFINNVISFVIVAFCVFMMVKVMNKLIRYQEAVAPPTPEEKLLTEIRDLLKNRPGVLGQSRSDTGN